MPRIRNLTGYDSRTLSRILRLALPYCAQPNSMLATDTQFVFRYMTFADSLQHMGHDRAWPCVLPRISPHYRIAVEVPPILCPTISVLRCLHWAGSSFWLQPPNTLDYWHDIVAKVGPMLIDPRWRP